MKYGVNYVLIVHCTSCLMQSQQNVLLIKDILLHLAKLLPGKAILKCMCVCKTWYHVMKVERDSRASIPQVITRSNSSIRKINACIHCSQEFYDCFIIAAGRFHLTCISSSRPFCKKKCINWFHHIEHLEH